MGDLDLYNFVDNHDVERILTKLQNKAHFAPVHVLLYTYLAFQAFITAQNLVLTEKKKNFPMPAYVRHLILTIMRMLQQRTHVLH